MRRPFRTAFATAARSFRPLLDAVERRVLPASFGPGYNSQSMLVSHLYDQFVNDVRVIELRSQATPAQYRALRDDARAISAVATNGGLSSAAASSRAVAATLQMDRAPLDGWLDAAGWAQLGDRLKANLQPLNVPQPLIDRTVADMKVVADAVGLSAAGFATYTKDFNQLRASEHTYTSANAQNADPGVFYTEHLRGFFRGWASEKIADTTALRAGIAALASPTGSVVLRRDAHVLQALGELVPSDRAGQILDAYAAVFAGGSPTASDLNTFRTTTVTILGPTLSTRHASQVDRLVADAPAFFQAAGVSDANVRVLIEDVRAVVNDGGGATLNPFRIQVLGVPGGGVVSG